MVPAAAATCVWTVSASKFSTVPGEVKTTTTGGGDAVGEGVGAEVGEDVGQKGEGQLVHEDGVQEETDRGVSDSGGDPLALDTRSQQ